MLKFLIFWSTNFINIIIENCIHTRNNVYVCVFVYVLKLNLNVEQLAFKNKFDLDFLLSNFSTFVHRNSLTCWILPLYIIESHQTLHMQNRFWRLKARKARDYKIFVCILLRWRAWRKWGTKQEATTQECFGVSLIQLFTVTPLGHPEFWYHVILKKFRLPNRISRNVACSEKIRTSSDIMKQMSSCILLTSIQTKVIVVNNHTTTVICWWRYSSLET